MGIKFSGINIIASDPVKSFEFYKGLGLPVLEEEKPDSEWYGATFKLTDFENSPVLWIWRKHDGDPEIKNLIVMDCENINQTHLELKAKGYPVSEPEMQFYGGNEMKLTDPDGNEILFLG